MSQTKLPNINILRELNILPASFYARDTRNVAIDLLGKVVVHEYQNNVLIAKIVETEAYLGQIDPACHAYKRYTNRNSVFYLGPGRAYIYINYGIHYCFNVITKPQDILGAVLIRAVEPLYGINIMIDNRKGQKGVNITNGPGKLSQALQINMKHNKTLLYEGELTLRSINSNPDQQFKINVSPRIGISKAVDWELRYFIMDNKYVSTTKHKNVKQINKDDSLPSISYYKNKERFTP